MKDYVQGSKGVDEKDDELPPIGEPVWVQCDHYRTLAFRDKHGKWRALVSEKELVGNLKVIESA